jgi:hypothetical protein
VDRVLEQDVEQPLAPEELGVLGEPGPGQVRQRFVVRPERPVGLERGAHRDNARRRQLGAVLVEIEIIRDPERGRVAQRGVGAREVEQVGVPRAARLGVVHVAHRLKRHAHEQPETLPLGLEQRLNRDVVGDVVSRRDSDPDNGEERRQQGRRDHG